MGIMLANAERTALQAMAAALEPPPPIDYLAWAENNVIIEEGSFPGPYNRTLFPYFDEILRALSPDDPCRFVTLMGSAQVGKTNIASIFTCGSLVMGKGNFLYAHPTEDNARRWSKMKLAPMMRSTAVVRERFPQRTRDTADFSQLQGTQGRSRHAFDYGCQFAGLAVAGDDPFPGAGRSGEMGDEFGRRSRGAGG